MITRCEWRWNGLSWSPVVGPACPPGQSCAAPTADGTYIGEPAFTDCEGPAGP